MNQVKAICYQFSFWGKLGLQAVTKLGGVMGVSRKSRISWLVGLIFAFGLFPAASQSQSPPIIDTHVHILPDPGLDFADAIASAIQAMDRHGISVSLVMSPPRPRDFTQNFEYGDFRAALKEYPGRFFFLGGGGSLNHFIHADPFATEADDGAAGKFRSVARQIAADGAVGFGELSSLHISLAENHAYSFAPADHPLLMVLADVAAETGLPVDLHMDAADRPIKPPPTLARFPNNPKTFPETLSGLKRLLAHNSRTRIVWVHAGTDHLGDFDPQTVGRLMEGHENLYVSLKVVGPKADTHNRLFTPRAIVPQWLTLFRRHPDRFVIGSDSFFTDPKSKGPGVGFASGSDDRLQATRKFLSLLPDVIARKIAFENAVRLYGLPNDLVAKTAAARNIADNASKKPAQGGLCRDGNLEHCKVVCAQGNQKACKRLKMGN